MHALRPMFAVLMLSIVFTAGCGSASNSSWGLPITLGQSDEQVWQLLGAPNEVIDYVRERSECNNNPTCLELMGPGDKKEWYYSSGIVANYQHGRLFRVTLYRHADYNKGALPYSGKIVEGISLNDSRENILHKLGHPTKVEENGEIGDLVTGKKAGPGAPAVWPAQEAYYWRRQHYTIEVLFLKQPQSVDDKQGIVWPKGEVMYVMVYQ